MKKGKRIGVCVFVVGSAVAFILLLVGLVPQLSMARVHEIGEASANSVEAFKMASTDTAYPGELITYTIIMYNSDPTEAVDVLMVDVIPDRTAYVAHTIADRVTTSGTLSLPGTGSLLVTNFIYIQTTLGSQGSVSMPWITLATLTVRVEEDAPIGEIVNSAQFWFGDEPQPLVKEAVTMIVGAHELFLPRVMRNSS